jgi:hypothetical protein
MRSAMIRYAALLRRLPVLTALFQHELLHVIHASDPERRFPPWVMEGLASCFATVTIRSDILTLGQPSNTWMLIVRSTDEALPLAQLFSWDRSEA